MEKGSLMGSTAGDGAQGGKFPNVSALIVKHPAPYLAAKNFPYREKSISPHHCLLMRKSPQSLEKNGRAGTQAAPGWAEPPKIPALVLSPRAVLEMVNHRG